MLLGGIADDFTGATDLAGAWTKAGLRTRVVLSFDAPLPDLNACAIALKSRSAPKAEAVAITVHALEWLTARRCPHIFFKYGSTFDSTPEGYIGPVAEALAERLGVRGVLVCPAFPKTGRTVYRGHLFVGDQLLSKSGMRNHPLTPMTDSNLHRWLGRQTTPKIGQLAIANVRQGPPALRAALVAARERGEILVIADALNDDDVLALGEAAAETPLATGSSALGFGLATSLRNAGAFARQPPTTMSARGPAAIIAGSCSTATRAQVRAYEKNHPTVALDVGSIVAGRTDPVRVAALLYEQIAAAPLCYSSAEPDQVAQLHQRNGQHRVAQALEEFFGRLATELVALGLARLVVAGGETSGAVVQALGLTHLDVGAEIDPGVPALSTTIDRLSCALALKSSNFGSVDFFEKAVRALGTAA